MEGAQDLLSKPGAKAPVWRHFGFKPNAEREPENPNEVTCKLCRVTVKASGGNTSNLRAHLVSNHKNEATKLGFFGRNNKPSVSQPHTQPDIAGAFSKGIPYKTDSARWKRCTEKVTRHLCKDMKPFNTVESDSFKDMVTTLDPQYKLPTRNYFSETAVPSAYSRIRGEMMTEISSVGHFSLTTDMWSSRRMTPYMSLTFHYIDSEWTLIAKCLQCSFLPEDHTADNIQDALQEALHEWGLKEENVVCITTDSGANIKAAARQLEWPWLSCFGHNLNLAVTNTIEKTEKTRTDRALEVCRAVNRLFSHSWRRRRELKAAQANLGLELHELVTVSL